jgi:hypothetical protein
MDGDKLTRLIAAYYEADQRYEGLVRAAMLAAVPDADEVDIARAIRMVAERTLREVELDLMRDRMN